MIRTVSPRLATYSRDVHDELLLRDFIGTVEPAVIELAWLECVDPADMAESVIAIREMADAIDEPAALFAGLV